MAEFLGEPGREWKTRPCIQTAGRFTWGQVVQASPGCPEQVQTLAAHSSYLHRDLNSPAVRSQHQVARFSCRVPRAAAGGQSCCVLAPPSTCHYFAVGAGHGSLVPGNHSGGSLSSRRCCRSGWAAGCCSGTNDPQECLECWAFPSDPRHTQLQEACVDNPCHMTR